MRSEKLSWTRTVGRFCNPESLNHARVRAQPRWTAAGAPFCPTVRRNQTSLVGSPSSPMREAMSSFSWGESGGFATHVRRVGELTQWRRLEKNQNPDFANLQQGETTSHKASGARTVLGPRTARLLIFERVTWLIGFVSPIEIKVHSQGAKQVLCQWKLKLDILEYQDMHALAFNSTTSITSNHNSERNNGHAAGARDGKPGQGQGRGRHVQRCLRASAGSA